MQSSGIDTNSEALRWRCTQVHSKGMVKQRKTGNVSVLHGNPVALHGSSAISAGMANHSVAT